MKQQMLTQAQLAAYRLHLIQSEKSPATISKYLRDAHAFLRFQGTTPVCKTAVLTWKQHLVAAGYAISSVNSMLVSVNKLLSFLGWTDCRVKTIRQQRRTYCPQEKELTKGEYYRLLTAAEGKTQLRLILQTICGTGIRVSELSDFTVEGLREGVVTVTCKGKNRTILIPGKLRGALLTYAKRQGITTGAIFRSRKGTPLHRSRIWAMMKALCQAAGVAPSKVYPHNLRKLFARTYYAMEKDIAKLADILGHSSINTTRIYIMTTGSEHRRQIERLGLIL